MRDTLISVENLSKQYRLGVINHGMLYKDLKSWWAQRRGKPDPYGKIGVPQPGAADRTEGDRFWALKDVSFGVQQGDRLGIIGRNGAGKTTLLKILSRITAPTSGEVKIRGRVASLLEVGTGFHQELTGRENVYLNGAILGMKKHEIDRKMEQIVSFAEVERFIDTPVKRYSSGMHVRLAFAVAAHLEPEILVVDEVLAVGDATFQRKCFGKMEDISLNEGRTVLFVSHNMGAIRRLCGRCVWLDSGVVRQIGKTINVVDEYLSVFTADSDMPEISLAHDPSKALQLTKVRVKNSSNKTFDTFEADEDILLELTMTSRTILPGVYGYLKIVDANNIPVIESDSDECRPQVLSSLPPGDHVFDLRIPKRHLGVGTYSVYFNFASEYHEGGLHVDSPGTVLSFRVVDSTSKVGNNRNASMSTLIEWEPVAYSSSDNGKA